MFEDEPEGELPREGHKHLTVTKIEVQPDRYKPIRKSKNIEVVRFKRAIVSFLMTEDSIESTLLGVLDFRGRTFTLSRRSGACNVGELMDSLGELFQEKYSKVGLGFSEPGNEKAIWEGSVVDPNLFLGYLH